MGLSDFKRWLKQEADIFYLSTSTDAFGGFKKEWVRKYSKEPCRIFGASGRVAIIEAGTTYPITAKLLCDVDTLIEKGDKVEALGQKFLVLGTTRPQTDEEHHLTVQLGRMDDEYGLS